jgi:hypothetical protein
MSDHARQVRFMVKRGWADTCCFFENTFKLESKTETVFVILKPSPFCSKIIKNHKLEKPIL